MSARPGAKYPGAEHSELCAWRFGRTAECDCGARYVAPDDPCPFVFDSSPAACIQCELPNKHDGDHESVLRMDDDGPWYTTAPTGGRGAAASGLETISKPPAPSEGET